MISPEAQPDLSADVRVDRPPQVRLPAARSTRWKLLRSGLLNLFKFDEQVFEYEDGHLLLRGNNGTGKSRILALQLPFLLDGEVAPQRVEPDGDPAKRMEWNLLLGKYPDRLGYTWLELGIVDEQGEPRYVTIGCGLRASTGRPLDRWFFLTTRRVGESLELQSDGHPLTRDRLTEALGDAGTIYRTAREYRRAVDEQFFHLGETRYRGLVNLLIQLRQPQLSRHLDDQRLSRALSEALPPLSETVVADVAESFRTLETDRHQLESFLLLRQGVTAFLTEYARYARLATVRRVGEVRGTHNAYEQTQRNLREQDEVVERTRKVLEAAGRHATTLESEEERLIEEIRTLEASPEMQSARELDRARQDLREREETQARAHEDHQRMEAEAKRAHDQLEVLTSELEAARKKSRAQGERATQAAHAADLGPAHEGVIGADLPEDPTASVLRAMRARGSQVLRERRESVEILRELARAVADATQRHELAQREHGLAEEHMARTREDHAAATHQREAAVDQYWSTFESWRTASAWIEMPARDELDEEFEFWVNEGEGDSPVRARLLGSAAKTRQEIQGRRTAVEIEHREVVGREEVLAREREALEGGEHLRASSSSPS